MPGLLEKDQVGKREDLADLLAVVDVRSTPFTSMVRKGKELANSLTEWQVDAYAAPSTNGVVDGTDVSDYENPAENRAMLYNHVQVFRRSVKVSRLAQNLSNVAGVADEIAKGAAKKLVEIKRDMEATFLASQECQADDGSVPYKTRGLGNWIQTGAQSLYPVPAAFRPASAQVVSTACASLTETDVQTVLRSIFDTTGMSGSYVLLAGSVLRRAFTDFTRTGQYANTNTAAKVRVFSGELAEKTVTATTTVFEGDFGTIEVIPSSWIGWSAGAADTDRGYLLDMDKVELRYKTKPSVEPLPDLGGGPRRLIEAVASLIVQNPIGLGKFQP